MSALYQALATVYEAMYQSFIDYQEEYDFYSNILRRFGKDKLLEVGSGTGNLASFFYDNGFQYMGLDLSAAMIALAQKRVQDAIFLQADMRDFKLKTPTDSILVTGRTLSYLLENKDVNAAFSSFFHNLHPGGILCFDFIDANGFIPTLANGKTITHQAEYNNITYVRESIWTLNLAHGMDFNWHSTFYKAGEERTYIGEDVSIARTFTLNEIEIFLSINGFKLVEYIARPAYAFPTYVVVAERVR